MKYAEQRRQIIENIKNSAGSINVSYVTIGESDYVMIKDIVGREEFIISRKEIEEV